VSDPAHVLPGASGPHVRKIQTALMLLDGAAISADEVQRTFYGASTAAAVLAYKQKRNIINRSYQTHADNIVGKMTTASLDSEMLKWEALPHAPVRIKPLSIWYLSPPRSPALHALLRGSRPFGVNVAPGLGAIGGPPHIHILPGPSAVLAIPPFGTGTFEVIDGVGGEVMIQGLEIVAIRDPAAPVDPWAGAVGEGLPVLRKRHLFNVVAGGTFGRTTIVATGIDDGPILRSQAFLDVAVRKPRSPTIFVPGVDHGHRPCDNWAAIQKDPKSDFWTALYCESHSAREVVDKAISDQLGDKPIAMKHLNWYLRDGKGEDFVEDDNIKDWLNRDVGIRNALKFQIFDRHPGQLITAGHFEFPMGTSRNLMADYAVEDFHFSFGDIDWVDFEVDFGNDTVHVWFKDRYEWHPVYPGLYELKSGDTVRPTNCVHAAMVEMKRDGAIDFWMIGEATVPLSLITGH